MSELVLLSDFSTAAKKVRMFMKSSKNSAATDKESSCVGNINGNCLQSVIVVILPNSKAVYELVRRFPLGRFTVN